MSELQIGLLVAGVLAVLAVYGYSVWQQRQHRRRFGATFRQQGEDVLLRDAAEEQTVSILGEAALGQALPPEPARATVRAERRRWPRECGLLDAATDYIAVLTFRSPANAQALAQLWQQRFDFRKNVCVCGLNTACGAWEKMLAESPSSYSAFKLALQLADRSGAASEAKLEDFRNLARDIAAQQQAEAELPDVAAAAARALELDNFCAEVDRMVGLNILPGGERAFSGSEIEAAAARNGMVLQGDGAFHLLDARGFTVFSLGNYDNAPFRQQDLGEMRVNGLTLLLDVPCVEQPALRFDDMAVLARQLAMGLRAAVVDDHRVALGEPGIAQIREQVAAIENRMLAYPIVPGSPQARRLFS